MTDDTTAKFGRQLEVWARRLDSGHASADVLREFARFYGPGLAQMRRSVAGAGHKMYPVAMNGSTTRGARAGWFKTPLRDGTFGYFQRRTDDCLQVAIASLLQIPPYLVPDTQIDKQRLAGIDPEEVERVICEKLSQWLEGRGLTMMIHPMPPRTGRWVGIVPQRGAFADHCLLMSGRECVFDSSQLLPPGRDEPVTLYAAADVDYGITIRK